MINRNKLDFRLSTLAYPLLIIMLIWFVFWLQIRVSYKIKFLAIYPLEISGLKGVLFSPFIHSDINHLYHNSLPLFILTLALFYFYRDIAWKIIIWGILCSGFLTWIIGRPSYHLGASGLIYVLVSFIFFKGIQVSNYRFVALSLLVVFLYGSMIWYVFPLDEKISWEGHLSGFITGALFSLLFKVKSVTKHRFDWEHDDYNPNNDPFMRQFDEKGNFIDPVNEEEVSSDE